AKPIGTYSYYHYSWKVKTSFTGVYDGAGHSIKNMTYDVTTDTAEGRGVGVFGTLGSQAVVKNLVIDSSCSFKGFMFVGAVAGDASMYRNTTISDCINYARSIPQAPAAATLLQKRTLAVSPAEFTGRSQTARTTAM
ncbi:MAG: hypothetical protein V8S89_07235, partial [Oscillospiraceae bacterium]